MEFNFNACNRISDEITISHAIRYARWNDLRTVNDAINILYKGHGQKTLIPMDEAALLRSLDIPEQAAFLNQATDLQLRINLGGNLLREVKLFPHQTYWRRILNLGPNLRALGLCSQCAQEQRDRFGFSYWKIDHCIPGISTCLQHNMTIIRIAWDEVVSQGILPHEVSNSYSQPETNFEARRFSEGIYRFRDSGRKYCPYSIAEATLDKLNQGSFHSSSWEQKMAPLLEGFLPRYPESFMRRLSCDRYIEFIFMDMFISKRWVASYLSPVFLALSVFESVKELDQALSINAEKYECIQRDFTCCTPRQKSLEDATVIVSRACRSQSF